MFFKCLNPTCSEPFRYFHHGRLFSLELPGRSAAPGSRCGLERFWLCNRCSSNVTVVPKDGQVILQQRFL